MNDVNQRQALEVAVIRSALASLRRAGFVPTSVYDGDADTKIPDCGPAAAADRVLTLALNLDECRVYFTGGFNVYLVFGNDGWDVISDWSYADTAQGKLFNATLDAVIDKVENIGTASGCESHTWAWSLRDGSGHGACIKCGRTKGPGITSRYYQ